MMKSMWNKKPIYWLKGEKTYISVPFTWNLPEVRSTISRRGFFKEVIVGGTALKLMPDYFSDLSFVSVQNDYPGMLQKYNPLATRTSLGCIRKCKFCAIGTGLLEGGGLTELEDWPDLPIICDNNLLATSQRHFDRVMDRLEKHVGADFNQGLDARLLNEYHADRFARLKKPRIRLSCDNKSVIHLWEESREKLLLAGVKNSRIGTYVLVGFDSDPSEAWERCLNIYKKSYLVYPMWFHSLDSTKAHSVSEKQKELGWTEKERRKIMRYFYHYSHGGALPDDLWEEFRNRKHYYKGGFFEDTRTQESS